MRRIRAEVSVTATTRPTSPPSSITGMSSVMPWRLPLSISRRASKSETPVASTRATTVSYSSGGSMARIASSSATCRWRLSVAASSCSNWATCKRSAWFSPRNPTRSDIPSKKPTTGRVTKETAFCTGVNTAWVPSRRVPASPSPEARRSMVIRISDTMTRATKRMLLRSRLVRRHISALPHRNRPRRARPILRRWWTARPVAGRTPPGRSRPPGPLFAEGARR